MNLSPDFKTELSLLKKVNQIGKKLTDEGKYVMVRGLLVAYENPHITMALVNEKLRPLFDFDYFFDKNIEVDGNRLYQLCDQGDFKGYEVTSSSIVLKFEVEVSITPEFTLDNFVEYCKKKGYTDYDVRVSYGKGFINSMELYNLYKKFNADLIPHTENKIIDFEMPFVDSNEKTISKAIKTLGKIRNLESVMKKDLSDEEQDSIMNDGLPYEIRYDDPCTFCKKAYLRVMKSSFPGISTSSNLSVEIVTDKKDNTYLVSTVNNSGNELISIFKILII